MPENKLTIVPVTLLPTVEESSVPSPKNTAIPSCIIKTATVEVSFFNGVEDRIIETIMKELNS